ncbi:MAG: RagB/SusD family nutrient uptake outer membrane protein, partial [Sphingobacteriales bacterium]
MKKIYNLLKFLVLGFLLFSGMTSCKKYLDVTPPNVGTLDYAFRNRNEAESYLYGCYNALQSMANPVNDPGFVTSSE